MKLSNYEQAVKIRQKIAENESKIKAISKAECITLVMRPDVMIDDAAIVEETKKIIVARLKEQNAAMETEFASL